MVIIKSVIKHLNPQPNASTSGWTGARLKPSPARWYSLGLVSQFPVLPFPGCSRGGGGEEEEEGGKEEDSSNIPLPKADADVCRIQMQLGKILHRCVKRFNLA